MHLVERPVRARGQGGERKRLGSLVLAERPRFHAVQVEVVDHGDILTMP